MLKRFLAAVFVAAGLVLAAPAAANAVDYPSGAPCSIDASTARAGDTATVTCVPGTWASSELITWTGTGVNGANIRMASSVTFQKHANADGSDLLRVTLPADASGPYVITGVGATSGHVCTVTVTVIPADASVSTVNDPGSSGLADTGSVIAAWALWTGAGLLVVGLVSVAIAAWLRKARSS